MSLYTNGTDEEFNFPNGENIFYSGDNQYYRIIRRMTVKNQGSNYYCFACSPYNETKQITISKDDETNMRLATCEEIIDSIWESYTYDGDHNEARTFVIECILKKCCIHNKNVTICTENNGDTFCFEFDGKMYSKNKTN